MLLARYLLHLIKVLFMFLSSLLLPYFLTESYLFITCYFSVRFFLIFSFFPRLGPLKTADFLIIPAFSIMVKVTGKNKKGKKLSKTLKCAVTVKTPSITLNKKEATLIVGGTEKLTATAKPASSQSSVTYASDKTDIATVAADGTVTAVAAGDATITATAKCGSTTKTATAKITVKKIALQSVKQTKLKTIEAVVSGKTDDLKKEDFKLQNKTTGTQVTVDSILVDKVDPTKVTITTFADMKNSNDIDVTLDGITKSFKATDAKVAAVSIDPVSIPFATQTKIYAVSKDANGVELDKKLKSELPAGFTLDVKAAKSSGYFGNDMLYLAAKGDTATAKVEYATGKIDPATGKAEVLTSGDVTITAVDPEALVLGKVSIRYGLAGDLSLGKKYDDLKDGTVIAKNDTVYAAVKILNSKNEELSDYTGYYLESSDNKVLIIDNKDLTGSTATVTLKAVNTGTVTILVKDKAGNTAGTFQINVMEERRVNGLSVNHGSFTVAANAYGERTVRFSAVDQYNHNYPIAANTLSVECTRRTTSDTTVATANASFTNNAGKGVNVYDFDPTNGLTAGTYTYTATLTGQHNLKFKTDVNVTVKNITGAATYKLALIDADGFETNVLDTSVTKENVNDVLANGITGTIKVLKIQNGVVSNTEIFTLNTAASASADEITLTGPAGAITGGAINTSTGVFTAVNSGTTASKVPTGDYTAVYKDGSTVKGVTKLTFTVKDSQEKPGYKRVKDTIDLNTVSNATDAANAVNAAFEFYDYDGSKRPASAVTVVDYKSVVGGVYISKVKVDVTVTDGTNTMTVPVTFDFNEYIAQK